MNNTFHINKITNPKGLKKDQYDVIIIGAGIGGLVCGCYLAKAGKKVLIIEKNNKIGGYCTSFKKNNFTFDTGVRAITHSTEGSFIREVINELGLEVELTKVGVSDIITTLDNKIYFFSDVKKTVEQLQGFFPKEAKKIKLFFDKVKNINDKSVFFSFFQEFKKETFGYMLNKYFKDRKLKTILGTFSVNFALSSFKASAISSIMLYYGYLINGDYYVKGGIEALSNAIVSKFLQYGGRIFLSTKVCRILFQCNDIKKIILDNGEYFFTKEIICNCDPNQVVTTLIDSVYFDRELLTKFKTFIPSSSAFIIYLGLKKSIKEKLDNCCGLWYLQDYNIDNFYSNVFDSKNDKLNLHHVLCIFPSFHDPTLAPQNGESIALISWVPYKNDKFWKDNKEYFRNMIIRLGQNIIPNLSSLIQTEVVTSPLDLERYTLNKNGSVRGWEVLPSQLNISFFLKKLVSKKIFFVGHWVTQYAPGGLFTAIFSAKRTVNTILN